MLQGSKRPGVNIPLAFKEKYRKAGKVTGETIIGDVNGKTVIIIDDMISTGTTVAKCAGACKKAGANGVIVAATHGFFVVMLKHCQKQPTWSKSLSLTLYRHST
jgi:ribose-phosphate pyrophosphokinase